MVPLALFIARVPLQAACGSGVSLATALGPRTNARAATIALLGDSGGGGGGGSGGSNDWSEGGQISSRLCIFCLMGFTADVDCHVSTIPERFWPAISAVGCLVRPLQHAPSGGATS
jgi:hypothetical protein